MSRALFSKLREEGRTGTKLRNFCSENIDLIIKYLPQRILESDDDLNYIFTGLTDSSKDLEYKIKVVDIVLEILRKNSTSLKHCGVLISRVRLELPRLPSKAVVKWCNDSVKSIIEDSDVNMIWCDILPECLNTLIPLDNIEHNNTTISGREYKAKCFEALLQCQWKKGQLVQLAAMFKDLQLTKQEHRLCVLKICTFLKDTPPDSLPPLAHQLLKLCRSYNMEIVLAHLSHYFNMQLFSNFFAAVTQDSESTTMDVDDIQQYSEVELHSCMSTCILYATQDAESVRKQLKGWPRSQLPREPFLLTLGLAMADKGKEFRTVCLDVIKSAIEHTEMDKIKSKESAWVRTLENCTHRKEIVLNELVKDLTDSKRHHQSIQMGLIYLGFALLGCGRGAEARGCARMGGDVLERLARAQPHTAPTVLALLADRLALDASHAHYADCLRSLCERAPLSVEPCTALADILESCPPTMPEVLEAVHPLVNYSIRVRDTLISVCRKGLYSRNSAYRCLAVCGILTVLKHLRVSGVARLDLDSQDAAEETASQLSQGPSQMADVHATQQCSSVSSSARNIIICDEMVRILQRCLGQDASVKQLLYTRWYSCVKDKPGLHDTVLDMLNEQLRRYLPEEAPTALLIDKCVQTNVANPVLLEPIGHLLYLIAQLLGVRDVNSKLESIFAGTEPGGFVRHNLLKLIGELAKCDLLATIDMEYLKLTDSTPESKASCIKVQQLLQVFEALIAHSILQWSPGSGHGDTVYAIYKAHNQLLENSKTPTKASKKASKLNETQESVKSTKSRKEQDKENVKKPPKAAKDKTGSFKPLPCLWDLKICYKVMELLHGEEVSWSTEHAALRRRGVFQRWAAQRVCSALQAHALAAHAHHAHAHALRHAPRLANLLYKRCLRRFKDLCDFDDDTALACLEVFHACFALFCLPKYHSHVAKFLTKITGTENVTAAENKATILETIRKALSEAEQCNASQGSFATNRRIVKELTDIAVTLLKMPTDLHLNLSKQIRELEHYARDSSQECVSLLVQLLAEAQADSCETALLDAVLARLAAVLGRVDQDQDPPTQSTVSENAEWAWISAGNVWVVLGHVCAHVTARVQCARHVLLRARDLAVALSAAVDADKLAIERERITILTAMTLQLCQLARCVRELCALRGARRALELAARLYALATDFARLHDPPSAAHAKLKNLVKLMGNPLTVCVRALCKSSKEGGRKGKLSDSKLLPRLVTNAENFYAAVLCLDSKGELNYRQYLSDRLSMSVKDPAGNSLRDNGMGQSGNDARDDEMDVDDTRDADDLDTIDVSTEDEED